jgi:hypothetical protein
MLFSSLLTDLSPVWHIEDKAEIETTYTYPTARSAVENAAYLHIVVVFYCMSGLFFSTGILCRYRRYLVSESYPWW